MHAVLFAYFMSFTMLRWRGFRRVQSAFAPSKLQYYFLLYHLHRLIVNVQKFIEGIPQPGAVMDHNDPHYMHRLQNVLQYLIQNPISAPDVISALAGWLVGFMALNATINNISVVLRSCILGILFVTLFTSSDVFLSQSLFWPSPPPH